MKHWFLFLAASLVVAGCGSSDEPQLSVQSSNAAGAVPRVELVDPSTGQASVSPLGANVSIGSGAHVALGDFNGDGVADLVVGAGPGGGPIVRVFDGRSGQILTSFEAYDSSFRGGVFVAVGHVLGHSNLDIVTGPGSSTGPSPGPLVRVFDGLTGQATNSFFAYDPGFSGGVRVAAADLDGDSHRILTGSGVGGGPRVNVYSGQGVPLDSFFAFDQSFSGGISLAVGTFAGQPGVIVGSGPGQAPEVKVFDLAGHQIEDFKAFPDSFAGGVRVASGLSRQGDSDILVGAENGPAFEVLKPGGQVLIVPLVAAGVEVVVASEGALSVP